MQSQHLGHVCVYCLVFATVFVSWFQVSKLLMGTEHSEHKLSISFTWLTSSCLESARKVICGGECIKNSLRSCVSITNN